jgi:hypothetical protein
MYLSTSKEVPLIGHLQRKNVVLFHVVHTQNMLPYTFYQSLSLSPPLLFLVSIFLTLTSTIFSFYIIIPQHIIRPICSLWWVHRLSWSLLLKCTAMSIDKEESCWPSWFFHQGSKHCPLPRITHETTALGGVKPQIMLAGVNLSPQVRLKRQHSSNWWWLFVSNIRPLAPK